MPVKVVHPDNAKEVPGGEIPSPPAIPSAIPGWMASRRERNQSREPLSVNSAVTPETGSPPRPAGNSAAFGSLAARSIAVKAVRQNSTVVRRFGDTRLSWKRGLANLLSTRKTIGIGFSILVHSVVLSVLASYYFSGPATRDEPQIQGVAGQVDDVGSDGILDTGLPSEAGESAPLQMSDVTQSLETLGSQNEFGQTLRTGFGGKGNGDGDEGTGASMHAAGLRIPGHAQTKGSFSAWSEPRDPKPGEEYEVVIRIRLPDKITKFRGSDITGNVIGTDRYRKTIRFRSNEFFPVENGAVEIRIQIPGAQRLVRDTIRVESRILREKQVFEIEF